MQRGNWYVFGQEKLNVTCFLYGYYNINGGFHALCCRTARDLQVWLLGLAYIAHLIFRNLCGLLHPCKITFCYEKILPTPAIPNFAYFLVSMQSIKYKEEYLHACINIDSPEILLNIVHCMLNLVKLNYMHSYLIVQPSSRLCAGYLHSKTPIPSVTYWAQSLHCDWTVTV